MIGRLHGILLEKKPPHLLLDVGGVGYELDVPLSTLYRLPPIGEPLTLHIHHLIREDAQLLYGFYELRERDGFRELIRLSGVGPKLALALLSTLEMDELIRVVQNQDSNALLRVPGVGKRTAERLLLELKERIKHWTDMPKNNAPCTSTAAPASHQKNAEADAVSALIALGFKPPEASRAVSSVAESGLASEQLIRLALKALA